MDQFLTLGQFFLLVLVIAAVILVYDVRQTLSQFRKTLLKTDETLKELRATIEDAHFVIGLIRTRTESLSGTVENIERTAGKVAAALEQLTVYVLKPVVLLGSLLGGVKAAFAAFSHKKKGGNLDVG